MSKKEKQIDLEEVIRESAKKRGVIVDSSFRRRVLNDYSKFDPVTGLEVHNRYGHEVPDATPMAPPVNFTKQPSLAERLNKLRNEYQMASQMAREDSERETLLDAEDFAIEDDPIDPHTPWEEIADRRPLADILADVKAEIESRKAVSKPPEPRPSPKGGDGDGGGKAPGERSEPSAAEKGVP